MKPLGKKLGIDICNYHERIIPREYLLIPEITYILRFDPDTFLTIYRILAIHLTRIDF